MQGIRIYSTPTDDLKPHKLNAGEYGYWQDAGHWVGRTPNGHMCNLSAHKVTQHEDGTITVHPSIGVRMDSSSGWAYHGWLERGVWRDA